MNAIMGSAVYCIAALGTSTELIYYVENSCIERDPKLTPFGVRLPREQRSSMESALMDVWHGSSIMGIMGMHWGWYEDGMGMQWG